MKKHTRRARRGFSLMEIMAAVVIIATVATATVTTLINVRAKSLEKLDEQNIADLNGRVQTYYLEVGAWPDANLNALQTKGYADTATHSTPYGGIYTFDNTKKSVVNTNAP